MPAATPEGLLEAPWAAPHVQAPVSGHVSMPGSKSATNRALLLAALAPGVSTLVAPLRARDTILMAAALGRLGAEVTGVTDAPGAAAGQDWTVAGRGAAADVGEITVDTGNAGTVARFLPPAAAVLARGTVTVDGDARMRERPLGPLLAALRALGAAISPTASHVPFTMQATGRLTRRNPRSRRLIVQPADLRIAAGRAPLRRGSLRPRGRRPGAVGATSGDDGRAAAGGGRLGRRHRAG